ncbi:helix-turn-helix domain-containing protein [Streptomyces sp. SID3343]|uniref:TetR/AcrR family transcriptional regulator n=1 Tax=Streptomyces sp. SID3343 TaxID=2690260 RepID=UPI00136C73D4|nr:helix-turn-helix domain-containing protein [Streptomyces sp. SID3343]MYV99397.1 TetR family transcriptional regulator [Streptomyces sp. SID3343]
MNSPVVSTRLRLIAAAEQLFAERGINAVSVREIAVAAEQRNNNAVRYHFGTKEDLVAAIFEHRMAPLNARRLGLLDSFDRHGRSRDPFAVAEAFTLPLVELLANHEHPSWYLRFCVQAVYTIDPDAAVARLAELGERPHTEGLLLLHRRAAQLTPELPEPVRSQRWHHFCAFVVHALADRELRECGGLPGRGSAATGKPVPPEFFVSDLVDAAVGILTAPARPATVHLASSPATTTD